MGESRLGRITHSRTIAAPPFQDVGMGIISSTHSLAETTVTLGGPGNTSPPVLR